MAKKAKASNQVEPNCCHVQSWQRNCQVYNAGSEKRIHKLFWKKEMSQADTKPKYKSKIPADLTLAGSTTLS
jgi:hypothetical protein